LHLFSATKGLKRSTSDNKCPSYPPTARNFKLFLGSVVVVGVVDVDVVVVGDVVVEVECLHSSIVGCGGPNIASHVRRD
jgi:hypothetical protein